MELITKPIVVGFTTTAQIRGMACPENACGGVTPTVYKAAKYRLYTQTEEGYELDIAVPKALYDATFLGKELKITVERVIKID